MSRNLSPCRCFPSGPGARVLLVLAAGLAALTLAAPAAAHHRDRPHAPRQVRAVDVGVHSVRVTWSRVTSARTYRLFRNGVTVRWKSAPRVHTFGGLGCNRSYRFAVRAYDRAGRRSLARSVSVRTDACPVPDPDPDPDPDPNGGCSVADTSGCVPGTTLTFTDAKFLCDRPLSSYGQLPLKVVVNFTPGRLFGGNGAIDLYTGCAGDGNSSTIDLIVDVEGDGTTYGPGVDAFKVRQGAGYNAGIQLTGHVDCGPKYTAAEHQDGVQLQGGRNIAFVDFSVGSYATGRSTCQGAGGAFFYSGASGYLPTNIDVVRGSYIACNHSLYVGAGGSGDIAGATFRSGRTDGTDPLCTQYHASPACTGDGNGIDPRVTLTSVTCQRWNATGDHWE